VKLWQKVGLAVIGALAGLALLVLLVLTQTPFGRERVRLFGLGQLASRVHGRVAVARVEGNLLSGLTPIGVSITDSAGNLFLRADTISLQLFAPLASASTSRSTMCGWCGRWWCWISSRASAGTSSGSSAATR
jgi:hypothetical protein